MKAIRAIAIYTVLAACVLWTMVSCMVETTRTITTDKGGRVTDVTTTRKGTDPAALALVSVATEIYLPRRPIVVRQEKSDADMRKLLRGWKGASQTALTGPLTKEEINNRWKPLP